jgi:hypothetical protein
MKWITMQDTQQLAKEIVARFAGCVIAGGASIELEIAIADALSDIRFETMFGPADEAIIEAAKD